MGGSARADGATLTSGEAAVTGGQRVQAVPGRRQRGCSDGRVSACRRCHTDVRQGCSDGRVSACRRCHTDISVRSRLEKAASRIGYDRQELPQEVLGVHWVHEPPPPPHLP